MKILVVHNYYQQPGGEDQVYASEVDLLRSYGHEVGTFEIHNDAVREMNPVRLAAATVWNGSTFRTLGERVRRERPDVVHFHNTLPLVSPSGYYAARSGGAAVVQTLHNFRLLCPGSLLMREGVVCEDCIGRRVKLPAIVHACYRDSVPASTAVTTMLAAHHAAGTWTRVVDAYVALTNFARATFIRDGFPDGRIHVKPNFTSCDEGPGDGTGGFALFVGRLVPEKGVPVLLKAWERMDGRIPLRIAGDGPLAGEVERAADALPNVEWLGRIAPEKVRGLMCAASLLVFPSTWYEGMPCTIVEAFSCGTPVLASRLGAMEEMIRHGETGFHVRPGSAHDLAEQVTSAMERPDELRRMRRLARAEYDAHYTAAANYACLMSVYKAALMQRHAQRAGRPLLVASSSAPGE